MNRIIKKCKQCNKPFSITEKEQKWLKEKVLELFSRCSECRKKNKNIKEDKK